ncbi:unnamed protein product, partial [marine sediment metagenome]
HSGSEWDALTAAMDYGSNYTQNDLNISIVESPNKTANSYAWYEIRLILWKLVSD